MTQKTGATAAGQWIQAGVCYRAYVPAPLPPALQFDANTDALIQAAVLRAQTALSALSASALPDVNPAGHLRREAAASVLLDAGDRALQQDSQSQIDAVVDATDYGVERMQRLPLSLRLLCELHAELMRGQPGSGEFRRHQTWSGPVGSAPATADYVPVPPGKLPELLGDWERYLHAEDQTHDFIRLALLHAQFDSLQPFAQGSERLNRLLIHLILIDRGWIAAPQLIVSEAIAAQGETYATRLRAVRNAADWSGWLLFFLQLLADAATASGVSSDTSAPPSP
ncbi:Fic family protein [Sinimarinibacterium sp. CAU 1509]|uniref:Fic family protein n=1 Tax=Sinimarinibacterium sp. CAU 1509 TaxID=2562283 RepID=UPI0010ACD952|nr:Fic family protein [Sinimarinibacterium sp. CAU 1509]TJY59020.1 Fic family protein [Sinimarinibacterium sp. CAU 1509]